MHLAVLPLAEELGLIFLTAFCDMLMNSALVVCLTVTSPLFAGWVNCAQLACQECMPVGVEMCVVCSVWSEPLPSHFLCKAIMFSHLVIGFKMAVVLYAQ